MHIHERRHHMRINDYLYFDYKLLQSNISFSENTVTLDLLGENAQDYLAITSYLEKIDLQLSYIFSSMAPSNNTVKEALQLLNEKINYLSRRFLLSDKIHLRKVNISLNGIAFRSKEKIPEQSFLKVILYTKPHFLPIILNAICVYNRTINPHHYRVALQFENMTQEQEKLLSQHIMLAQEVPYPITS